MSTIWDTQADHVSAQGTAAEILAMLPTANTVNIATHMLVGHDAEECKSD
jgi:hypothetical protein